jgi:hypothetical protein
MKRMREGATMLFGFACALGLVVATPVRAADTAPLQTQAPRAAQMQALSEAALSGSAPSQSAPSETAPSDTTSSEAAPAALIIRDFVLTRGIDAREPVDRAESFRSTDDQAYAFLRIANDGPPADLTVEWRYEGAEHGSVALAIGRSPGWRTWSSANLKPGDWRVAVSTADGQLLAERRFTVGTELADESGAAPGGPAGAAFQQVTQEPGSAVSAQPAAPGDGDG